MCFCHHCSSVASLHVFVGLGRTIILNIFFRLTVLNVIVPVVAYSVLTNVHQLFMFYSSCFERDGYKMESYFCENGHYVEMRTSEIRWPKIEKLVKNWILFRWNIYYVVPYLIFSSLNIIIPFVIVMVLNVLSYRFVYKLALKLIILISFL